jgi:hypothetical protein
MPMSVYRVIEVGENREWLCEGDRFSLAWPNWSGFPDDIPGWAKLYMQSPYMVNFVGISHDYFSANVSRSRSHVGRAAWGQTAQTFEWATVRYLGRIQPARRERPWDFEQFKPMPDSTLLTLAQIPSRKTKGKLYTVKQNPATQAITCDCPGWIYSKREPRSCRHTLTFERLLSQTPITPGSLIPMANPDRTLTAAEVDARNIQEFGTDRPSFANEADIAASIDVATQLRQTIQAREQELEAARYAEQAKTAEEIAREARKRRRDARRLNAALNESNGAARAVALKRASDLAGGDAAVPQKTTVTVEAPIGTRVRSITFEDD